VIRRAVDARKRSEIALETPPREQDLEIDGPLAASFWMSSSREDIDLFLTRRHFDTDGNEVLGSANRARRCRR
jgi:predicted acyl esterase